MQTVLDNVSEAVNNYLPMYSSVRTVGGGSRLRDEPGELVQPWQSQLTRSCDTDTWWNTHHS